MKYLLSFWRWLRAHQEFYEEVKYMRAAGVTRMHFCYGPKAHEASKTQLIEDKTKVLVAIRQGKFGTMPPLQDSQGLKPKEGL